MSTVVSKQPHPAIELVSGLVSLGLVVAVGTIVLQVLDIVSFVDSGFGDQFTMILGALIGFKVIMWAVNGRNRQNLNGWLTLLVMLAGAWFMLDLLGFTQIPVASPPVRLAAVLVGILLLLKLGWMTVVAMNHATSDSLPGQAHVAEGD